MATTSLPNSDGGSVVSDQSDYSESDFTNVYVVRMTPMGAYTLDDLKKGLEEMGCISWILAVESKPKLHYHLVVEHEDDLDDMKARLRSFLFMYFPVRPRGWGNAQYNCQISNDKRRAISYALKDREEYFFEGYAQEYIDECLEESFPKNSPSTFKVEYQELCNSFHDSDMDIEDFMVKFITLKAKYNQQVQLNVARGFAYGALIRRDPSAALNLVRSFNND